MKYILTIVTMVSSKVILDAGDMTPIQATDFFQRAMDKNELHLIKNKFRQYSIKELIKEEIVDIEITNEKI